MGPGPIQIPHSNMTSWLDPSSTPTSASTLKPVNGYKFPQTPGLAIGFATPGILSPLAGQPSISLPSMDNQKPLETPSARSSTDQHVNDYFSRPLSGGNASATPITSTQTSSPVLNGRLSNENQSQTSSLAPPSTDAEPTTPSPEKSGLFGKKFKRMNLIPKSLKKSDKGLDTKTPIPDEQHSDSDGRNSQADDRLNEDSFLGNMLRMRHTYELQSRNGVTDPDNVGLNIQPPPPPKDSKGNPTPVTSLISPSLPNETPVIKPPPETIILIQEDSADSGGVADLWEGTVGSVGHEAEVVERVAPAWLADVLLRNVIPLKDLVKVSFVLEPWEDLLPAVSTDGNTRLNANRMLRARKIMTYIADRIEPQSEQPDPDAMKAEEYLELYCHDQVSIFQTWRILKLSH
jgi:WD repeat-containing protein 48